MYYARGRELRDKRAYIWYEVQHNSSNTPTGGEVTFVRRPSRSGLGYKQYGRRPRQLGRGGADYDRRTQGG